MSYMPSSMETLLKLYRISKAKYGGDFSGEGGKKGLGRWHHKGGAVIYTASSVALAILETLVHTPITRQPRGRVLVSMALAEDIQVKYIDISTLDKNWHDYIALESTKTIGSEWLESYETAVLGVPSVVTKGAEMNYLINPLHPDAKAIKIVEIESYVFDKRLRK
ncbi:MAG: RES family NAD+ phosphorylase [Gammaproteobacteria bacterium]|nr:RES family NAD+ phosphorylase [Gammaproteobacteria bacterium]